MEIMLDFWKQVRVAWDQVWAECGWGGGDYLGVQLPGSATYYVRSPAWCRTLCCWVLDRLSEFASSVSTVPLSASGVDSCMDSCADIQNE